jgi:hypothetical protein
MSYNWKVQGKLAKLMKLAYMVNSRTDKAVWVEFAGRCQRVDFRIAVTKLPSADVLEYVYLHHEWTKPLQQIEGWIEMLEKELVNEQRGTVSGEVV